MGYLWKSTSRWKFLSWWTASNRLSLYSCPSLPTVRQNGRTSCMLQIQRKNVTLVTTRRLPPYCILYKWNINQFSDFYSKNNYCWSWTKVQTKEWAHHKVQSMTMYLKMLKLVPKFTRVEKIFKLLAEDNILHVLSRAKRWRLKVIIFQNSLRSFSFSVIWNCRYQRSWLRRILLILLILLYLPPLPPSWPNQWVEWR